MNQISAQTQLNSSSLPSPFAQNTLLNSPSLQHKNQASTKVFNFLLDAIRGQVFIACIELGILDLLAEGHSLQAISERLNIAYNKLVLFLNALSSMEVLEKHDDQFVINPIFTELLVRNQDVNMITTFLHLYKVRYRSSADIIEILTNDSSVKTTETFSSPTFWRTASSNLLSFHKSVMAESVLSILEASLDITTEGSVDITMNLESIKSMMDLGAGSEVLAQHLTAKNPAMTVYIQDQLPLIESIKERLELSKKTKTNPDNKSQTHTQNDSSHNPTKNTQNIQFVAGDYNEVAFPKSLDLILSSMSLYYAKDLPQIIKKIFDALAPHGAFISLHESLANGRSEPEAHVLGRLIPSLSGNDSSFAEGEIENVMHLCGFKRISATIVSMPQGEMNLVVGYKQDFA